MALEMIDCRYYAGGMVSPRVRRAIHEAIDHVLDAIAEDGREAKPARRASRATPPKDAATIDPFTMKKAETALKRAGMIG